MQRIVKSGIVSLIGGLWIILGPGAALAQQSDWDPEQVAELAGQMATEVRRMRTAIRKEPHVIRAASTTKQRATAVYLETLKKLDQAAAKLARQLSAGDSREQTLGTARRIDSLLRDVRQQGAKVHSTDWTQRHFDPALGLAAQLRTYYGGEPMPAAEESAD